MLFNIIGIADVERQVVWYDGPPSAEFDAFFYQVNIIKVKAGDRLSSEPVLMPTHILWCPIRKYFIV